MNAGTNKIWICATLLLVQYLLTAVSARHPGVRFVCNVLSIHVAKKVTAAKPQM